jgi:salicylate hydroxylase
MQMKCTEGHKVNKWVINVVRGLPTFAHGRVAVLGDAVRIERLPNLPCTYGTGSLYDTVPCRRGWSSARGLSHFAFRVADSNFVQDSYTLSILLAHPLTTRETITQALKAYSQARHAIAQRFVEFSRDLGMHNSFNKEEGQSLAEVGARIGECRAITMEGDPLRDAQEAVELLKTFVA